MKQLPLILIGAALAASGASAQPAARRMPGVPSAPVPADCPLAIGFASYAAGIDRGSFQAVEALLRRDRGVRSVSNHHWGREGEVTLCARTRTRGGFGAPVPRRPGADPGPPARPGHRPHPRGPQLRGAAPPLRNSSRLHGRPPRRYPPNSRRASNACMSRRESAIRVTKTLSPAIR